MSERVSENSSERNDGRMKSITARSSMAVDFHDLIVPSMNQGSSHLLPLLIVCRRDTAGLDSGQCGFFPHIPIYGT